MAKVITLSGLERTASLGEKCTPVKAYLPELQREVTLCSENLPADIGERAPRARRKRGRPKGSTTRSGARAPWRGKVCSRADWKTDKHGQQRCQCVDPQLHSFQKAERCERNRRATPVSEGD